MESWIRGDPLGKPTGKGRARQYCSDRCQKRAHRERETDGDVTKLAVTNTFLPFEEARYFARSLRLRSKRAWNAYCASGEKPASLPSHPEHAYKGKWKNWGDWLGTREYLPFEEARAFVRALGLKDHRAWRDYCTSGEKPAEVPACPNLVYPHVFRGWGDWLGVPSRWTKRRLLAFLADLRGVLRHLEGHELYLILEQGGALPALRMALQGASPMQVIRDLMENDGKGTELAI